MAALTAFRGASSRAAGAPKTDSAQSPTNLMTVPPLLTTADSMSAKQRFIRLATSSGSMRPPREVKPEMSANNTVTWRRSPSESRSRISIGSRRSTHRPGVARIAVKRLHPTGRRRQLGTNVPGTLVPLLGRDVAVAVAADDKRERHLARRLVRGRPGEPASGLHLH